MNNCLIMNLLINEPSVRCTAHVSCSYGCMVAWVYKYMDVCMYVCMSAMVYGCMGVWAYVCVRVYGRMGVCVCACINVVYHQVNAMIGTHANTGDM